MKDNYGPSYATMGSQPSLNILHSDGPRVVKQKEKVDSKDSDWISKAMAKYKKNDIDKDIPTGKAPKNPYETLIADIPEKIHVINDIGKKSIREDKPRHMPSPEGKWLETSDVESAESKSTQVDPSTKHGLFSKQGINRVPGHMKSNYRALVKNQTREKAKLGRHPAFQSASGFLGQGIDVADMFQGPVAQIKKAAEYSKLDKGAPQSRDGSLENKNVPSKTPVGQNYSGRIK